MNKLNELEQCRIRNYRIDLEIIDLLRDSFFFFFWYVQAIKNVSVHELRIQPIITSLRMKNLGPCIHVYCHYGILVL